MKKNSSFEFSTLSGHSRVASETGIETKSVVVWSRRSVLFAAGMFFLMPRFALARVFQCGPKLRILLLVALTGRYASVHARYYEGVEEAVKTAIAKGCFVSLVSYDVYPSPGVLIDRAMSGARKFGASVIIAPFGPTVGRLVAQKVSSALIFDISNTSPFGSPPVNLVTLPYSLFLTVDPKQRDESLRSLGRVAARIVLDTIQSSSPGTISSPNDLVKAMALRKFSSPKGTLALNRFTGAFELIR